MATSDADWFGNVINAILFNFLNSFIAAVGFWMVVFGQPDFYWDTMTSFGLLAPDVEAQYLYFN